MGLAWRKDMDDGDTIAVSDEAKRRVDTARVRDLAFKIKSQLGFGDDDADALARVLVEAADRGIPATRRYAYGRLIEIGRTPSAAELISKILPE
jgi:hypothetical protein